MGAQRALLLFRVALCATVVALLAWQLGGRGEASEIASYRGTTSQNRPLVLTVDGDVAVLETRVETMCRGLRPGTRTYTSWSPGRRAGRALRIAGRSGRDYGDGWTSRRSYEVTGEVDTDAVNGRIRVEETWDGGSEGRTRCAGTVAFSAQR